ncbi:hypothetical protein XNC1_1791 [Xenorhabdus nematophila ATCC 19061]|uniref:Uncharacterized protein n=1 Tax=Xenorhabdus nematophila (strain ATCC 19061 / DSM 3370 / CCUG 14189 / LMG 1036 / NCIMB 9965 / AN6) TaxID=406817 RepID=D3VCY5_XENNA|nr:hypothetical protein XNC1_1791 [Xenorhabdus nematophila ATCC 19061]
MSHLGADTVFYNHSMNKSTFMAAN